MYEIPAFFREFLSTYHQLRPQYVSHPPVLQLHSAVLQFYLLHPPINNIKHYNYMLETQGIWNFLLHTRSLPLIP